MKKNDKKLLLFFLFVVFFSFGLKIYQNFYWPRMKIKLNNHDLKVLVADNPKHWIKGVGGKESLDPYDGMLFVFPDLDQRVFVMRDTLFPLDIIWLKKGEIVEIAPRVPTEIGRPENELTQYYARDLADMVLEVPSGTASMLGLKIGDRLSTSD